MQTGKIQGVIRVHTVDRWVTVLLLAGFSWLVLRGQGVLPSIMADEWHYSLLSRLLPFSKSDDPGFAYLGLYGATTLCAGGYLGCARVLNSLFFAGSCFLIFLAARKLLPPGMAILTLALALLMPESVYTLFFMPESAYFFAFWLFAYLVISRVIIKTFGYVEMAACGALLALAALVKPHALFLVGCFSLFLLIVPVAPASLPFARRVRFGLTAIVAFLVVKFSYGFLAAGAGGITLFGKRYGSMAAQNISAERLADMLMITMQILFNHLALIAFVFFVPIFGAFKWLFSPPSESAGVDRYGHRLALFGLILLVPMLGVTAAFSASVAGTNPYDVVDRMHMRYYSFILPIFIVLAAVLACRDDPTPSRGRIWAAVICIPLFIAGAWRLGIAPGGLQINWVDSPGMMFLLAGKGLRLSLLVLGIGLATLALINLRLASRLFLLAFLPLLFFVNAMVIQRTVEDRKTPDAYDVAGILVGGLIAGRPDERVILFGPDEALLYKASFFLDRSNTAIHIVSPGGTVDPVLVPEGVTRVLIFGGGQLERVDFDLVLDQGFKLFNLRGIK